MQTMTAILTIVTPVMLLIAAGWLAARSGFVSEKAGDGLSEYVFSLAVPALIVVTLTKPAAFSTIVPGYWLAYFGGVAVVWALAMLLARRRFARGQQESVLLGFAAGQSNIVLLGVPLILGSFGEAAAPAMFLLFAVHLPVMMTAAALMMETPPGGVGAQLGNLARTLSRNPIIVALLLGAAMRILGLFPEGFVKTFLDAVGATASTCALIAMGLSLSRYRLRGQWTASLCIVFLKLLVHPFIVWLLAFPVLGLPRTLGSVATLFAALPTGINAYLLAARYRAGEETVSSVIVLSTTLSVFSLSLWLGLML